MKFVKQISTIVLCLIFDLLYGQHQIHGVIQSLHSNQPIKAVQLSILELNRYTNSKDDGHFSFDQIPDGVYTISLKKEGWFTQLLLYNTKEPKQLQLTMKAAEIAMNEVLVSGARPSLPERSSQQIEQLDVNTLRKNGDLTLMDALNRIPGVSVISTGMGIARPVIRGLSGNRIACIVNNVKLENQQWDLEHTLGINQYGISRVEIIKGPASFLYGSDAMGGVIHLIDELPATINSTQADVVAGLYSNTFGSMSEIGVKQTKNKLFWGIRSGLNNHSDYYDAQSNRIANSRFREFSTKLFLGINRKNSLSYFNYQMNMGYYGIVEPFELDSTTKEEEAHPMEFEKPYHTYQHHMLNIKNTQFMGKTKLNTSISYQYDGRNEIEPNDQATHPFLGFNLHTLNSDFQIKHALNANNAMSCGIQAVGALNANDGYSRLIPDYKQLDLAVYTLNQFGFLNKKLLVDIGLRYDVRNIHSIQNGSKDSIDYMAALAKQFNNLSSSIGFNVEAHEHLHFFGNWGMGFRAPNMAELTSNGIRLETQRYEVGNENFKKETNQMQELGFTMNQKNWSFVGSAYLNAIANYIYMYQTQDSILAVSNGLSKKFAVFHFNQSDASIFGVEAKLDLHPNSFKWVQLLSSYTNTKAALNTGQYLPQIAPNKINTQLIFKPHLWKQLSESNVKIEYNYVWAQNHVYVNELKTPAYHLIHLSVNGNLQLFHQKFMLAMGVNNLFNTSYFEHLSRLRAFQIHAMGMNVFLSVKVPLQFK